MLKIGKTKVTGSVLCQPKLAGRQYDFHNQSCPSRLERIKMNYDAIPVHQARGQECTEQNVTKTIKRTKL